MEDMTPVRRPRADADWRVRAAGALLRASPGQIVAMGALAVIVALLGRCDAVRDVLCGPALTRPLPKGPAPGQVVPPCPAWGREANGGCYVLTTSSITVCGTELIDMPGEPGRCYAVLWRKDRPSAVERASYSKPEDSSR